MFDHVFRVIITVSALFLLWGCSSESDVKRTHISGNFTVPDSIDNSRDFSGIGLTIFKKDSANADADTLFHVLTDTSGTFSGLVTFEEKRQYPMIISRNNRNLLRSGVILADGDSVNITGELGNLGETLSISSREHDAMDTYQRLNRNFARILKFARSGRLSGDTLQTELQKWTDLYWEVYEDNQGTIGSQLAARESIRILSNLDKQKMMNRIRLVQENDQLSDLGATYGKEYIAQSQGLDPAVAYLDSLSSITNDEDKAMQIDMEHIKLLYDSARVSEAQKMLNDFKNSYTFDQSTKQWVESITYDLNYLSPGDFIPDFSFRQNGDIVSRDSLMGSPYILEITRLSNRLYQNQFDRTVVIHSIYKNFGMEVVTIPLDTSQVTVDAFFQERVKPWPVASAKAFEREKLLKEFNVQVVPTRFLIDREGKIVRKYVGNEFADVIQDIQTIIKNDKEPAS